MFGRHWFNAVVIELTWNRCWYMNLELCDIITDSMTSYHIGSSMGLEKRDQGIQFAKFVSAHKRVKQVVPDDMEGTTLRFKVWPPITFIFNMHLLHLRGHTWKQPWPCKNLFPVMGLLKRYSRATLHHYLHCISEEIPITLLQLMDLQPITQFDTVSHILLTFSHAQMWWFFTKYTSNKRWQSATNHITWHYFTHSHQILTYKMCWFFTNFHEVHLSNKPWRCHQSHNLTLFYTFSWNSRIHECIGSSQRSHLKTSTLSWGADNANLLDGHYHELD